MKIKFSSVFATLTAWASFAILGALFSVALASDIPVKGAFFHVDASDAKSMTFAPSTDGTNWVSKWADTDGGSIFATSDKIPDYNPYLDLMGGRPILNFGKGLGQAAGSRAKGVGCGMAWSQKDTSIREVFVVFARGFDGDPATDASYNHVLTDNTKGGTYHFHNGGAQLFNAKYVSASIQAGKIELNRESASATTTMPANQLVLLHVRTTGSVTANAFANDRSECNFGKIRYGEVVVFNTTLADAEAAQISNYLYDKWISEKPFATVASVAKNGSFTISGKVLSTAGATGADQVDVYLAQSATEGDFTYEKIASGLKKDGKFSRQFSGLMLGDKRYWSVIVSNNLDGVTYSGVAENRNAPQYLFSRHAELTVPGYQGISDLVRFPVLVRLSEGSPAGFSYADCADGSDLCFTDSAGVLIPYEIDTWDTSGESCVWVLLPKLAKNSTKFNMYWGAAADATMPANDPTDVWVDYFGVWHMSETEGNIAHDSTKNQIEAEYTGTFSEAAPSSAKVGRARCIEGGTTAYFLTEVTKMTSGQVQNLADVTKFSPSGWFYSTTDAWDKRYCFFFKSVDFGKPGWYMNTQAGEKYRYNVIGAGANYVTITDKTNEMLNKWLYQVGGYDGGAISLYQNGKVRASASKTAASESTVALRFAENIKGMCDEMRIRNCVTTADRVKADYDTINAEDFVAFSAVDTPSFTEPVIGDATAVVDEQAGTLTIFSTVFTPGNEDETVDAYLSFSTNGVAMDSVKLTGFKSGETITHALSGLTSKDTVGLMLAVSNSAYGVTALNIPNVAFDAEGIAGLIELFKKDYIEVDPPPTVKMSWQMREDGGRYSGFDRLEVEANATGAEGETAWVFYAKTRAELEGEAWKSALAVCSSESAVAGVFTLDTDQLEGNTDYFLLPIYETEEGFARGEIIAYKSVPKVIGGLGKGGRIMFAKDGSGDIVHVFDTPGESVFTAPKETSGGLTYLLLGGGGAGGGSDNSSATGGGGGGGGQFLEGEIATVGVGEVFTIKIGAGGTCTVNSVRGNNGETSQLRDMDDKVIAEAIGGGGGGASWNKGTSADGLPGANGGGAGGKDPAASGGEATVVGGYSGGNGGGTRKWPGGGGGGAGGAGDVPNGYNGGAGGVGRESLITGERAFYCGGGGGGGGEATAGGVGNGGGGNGGIKGTAGGTGVNGFGGGGGGGCYSVGGAGGCGAFIVRYPLPKGEVFVETKIEQAEIGATDIVLSNLAIVSGEAETQVYLAYGLAGGEQGEERLVTESWTGVSPLTFPLTGLLAYSKYEYTLRFRLPSGIEQSWTYSFQTLGPEGTGGDEVLELSTGEKVHIFNTNGVFTAPVGAPMEVEYLIVGGGGASGGTDNYGYSGGGGGGQAVTGKVVVASGATLNIEVGAGGLPVSQARGKDGKDSWIEILGNDVLFETNQQFVAYGGGGGGRSNDGGGGWYRGTGGGGGCNSTRPGGTWNMSGVDLPAKRGGNGGNGSGVNDSGGGGGGAGADGGNASGATAGKGGDGIESFITGKSVWYGGGGGGGRGGAGGKGGGGVGNSGVGQDGLGGGGGGINWTYGTGLRGGSGIVILRYKPLSGDVFASFVVTNREMDSVTFKGELAALAGGAVAATVDLRYTEKESGVTNLVSSCIANWHPGEEQSITISALKAGTEYDYCFAVSAGSVTNFYRGTFTTRGISGTGGELHELAGGWLYHVFVTNGEFFVPCEDTEVEYLIVGGGGDAGDSNNYSSSGGGGGGQVVTGRVMVAANAKIEIEVGAGGASKYAYGSVGTDGKDSWIVVHGDETRAETNRTYLAYGGGGGGGGSSAGRYRGTGGGGGANKKSGGTYSDAGLEVKRGGNGGTTIIDNQGSSGGGGAGEDGEGANGKAGKGGDGIESFITGVSEWYGGGGGGGGSTGGKGGRGGGGNGASNKDPRSQDELGARPGEDGKGGGGGGINGGSASGQHGGSGTVILRYRALSGAIFANFAVTNRTYDTVAFKGEFGRLIGDAENVTVDFRYAQADAEGPGEWQPIVDDWHPGDHLSHRLQDLNPRTVYNYTFRVCAGVFTNEYSGTFMTKGLWGQGGDIHETEDGSVYHIFTEDGTFVPPPGEAINLSYLVIGGGGGGGGCSTSGGAGGGGGAGQVVTGELVIREGMTFSVLIGGGGAGGVSGGCGKNGDDSKLEAGDWHCVALGGGGGGGYDSSTSGSRHGNGGGGSSNGAPTVGGRKTLDECFNGGSGTNLRGHAGVGHAGGGGAGAGEDGLNAGFGKGGNGGRGVVSTITEASVIYAGGGAGGAASAGDAGKAGEGADRFGGGGNGASSKVNGGAGQKGVVIIRYRAPSNEVYCRVDVTSVDQHAGCLSFSELKSVRGETTAEVYLSYGLEHGEWSEEIRLQTEWDGSPFSQAIEHLHSGSLYRYKVRLVATNGSKGEVENTFRTLGHYGSGGEIFPASDGSVWHVFNAEPGEFEFVAPPCANGEQVEIEYVLVGGGGGGGGSNNSATGSGGGGGGNVLHGRALIPGGSVWTCVVGAGGEGGVGNTRGTNGGDSIIRQSEEKVLAMALGGGGGGSSSDGTCGCDGGNGGGGGRNRDGGRALSPTGFPGGKGGGTSDNQGGGGGGAGGDAGAASGTTGAAGGSGRSIMVMGEEILFGAGGGGGGSGTGGAGGAGGGGAGGSGATQASVPGVNKVGAGGGGGASNHPGANGGYGAIYIRYFLPSGDVLATVWPEVGMVDAILHFSDLRINALGETAVDVSVSYGKTGEAMGAEETVKAGWTGVPFAHSLRVLEPDTSYDYQIRLVASAVSTTYTGTFRTLGFSGEGGEQQVLPDGSVCVIFREDGTYTAPYAVVDAEYLLVGGGGGGGGSDNDATCGGGGGGGEVVTGTMTMGLGQKIAVAVGRGGDGGYNGERGLYGADSSLACPAFDFRAVATGGGAGGAAWNKGTTSAGLPGANGGGGGGNGDGAAGGEALSPNGFPGGNCGGKSNYHGGGGGGAGGAGGVPSDATGGAGGAGLSSDITGEFYAGGGAGGGTGAMGAASAGGGSTNGGAGVDGFGGGGAGGVGKHAGGRGGRGIVILRFMPNKSRALVGVDVARTGPTEATLRFQCPVYLSGDFSAKVHLTVRRGEAVERELVITEDLRAKEDWEYTIRGLDMDTQYDYQLRIVSNEHEDEGSYVGSFKTTLVEGVGGKVYRLDDGYVCHQFDEDGIFVSPVGYPVTVEYLLVGGGGGGGSGNGNSAYPGGGGGGGQVVIGSFKMDSMQTARIAVGLGGGANGVDGRTNARGDDGGDSTVTVIGDAALLETNRQYVAYGGGGGGRGQSGGGWYRGTGGGGGSNCNIANGQGLGGTYNMNGVNLAEKRGGNGGNGYSGNNGAGGGGGAGADGAVGGDGIGGKGGDGIESFITGGSVWYGGGGGGGASSSGAGGKGGLGGGGSGGNTADPRSDVAIAVQPGVDGLGGGGGGAYGTGLGAPGGRGVVILRYKPISGEIFADFAVTNRDTDAVVFKGELAALAGGAVAATVDLRYTEKDSGVTNFVPGCIVNWQPGEDREIKIEALSALTEYEYEFSVSAGSVTNFYRGTFTTMGIHGTGGEIHELEGGWIYHVFRTNGVFTTPPMAVDLEYLIVGGGGASGKGGDFAAGGGGGGCVATGQVDVAALRKITIEVGHGGQGIDGDRGQDGADSWIFIPGDGLETNRTYLALGGGGGANDNKSGWYRGTGGGGARSGAGGTAGSVKYGGNGGKGSANNGGGGGGGAGQDGTDATSSDRGGHGGDGIPSGITGEEVWYGGGGGGSGSDNNTIFYTRDGVSYRGGGGAPGKGGGGRGSYCYDPRNGTDIFATEGPGKDGFGGGGGGGVKGASQPGGSGVVILRYRALQGEIFADFAVTNRETSSVTFKGELTALAGGEESVDIYFCYAQVGGATNKWELIKEDWEPTDGFSYTLWPLAAGTDYLYFFKLQGEFFTKIFEGRVSTMALHGTGGEIHELPDGWFYHSFTNNGVFVAPCDDVEIEYLLVGGGGAGGAGHSDNVYPGGGGGGGQVVTGHVVLAAVQQVRVEVGRGGKANGADIRGDDGGDSWLEIVGDAALLETNTFIVGYGGGGGGNSNQDGWYRGTGGGGGSNGSKAGGTYDMGGVNLPAKRGGNGGNGLTSKQDYSAGGGGGAGFDGCNASGKNGGAGGDGIVSDITGEPIWYGGGGGGGGDGTGGAGGKGGGGSGGNTSDPRSSATITVQPGVDGLGGGGGGGKGKALGARGGSGIVIVRYRAPTEGVYAKINVSKRESRAMNFALKMSHLPVTDPVAAVDFKFAYHDNAEQSLEELDWQNKGRIVENFREGDSANYRLDGIKAGHHFTGIFTVETTGGLKRAYTNDFATLGLVGEGGELHEIGDGWYYHSFTNDGVFVAPEADVELEYLVVGGGGAGGSRGEYAGGGGGGGAVTTGYVMVTANQECPVTVGIGGIAMGDNVTRCGSDSNFLVPGENADLDQNFTALGGGGGGASASGAAAGDGLSRGTGGGGAADGTGGTGSQGYNGGKGVKNNGGGGGGGAGGAGANAASTSSGGKGGDGIMSTITGEEAWYGGGGGGSGDSDDTTGAYRGGGGLGGKGGGGRGSNCKDPRSGADLYAEVGPGRDGFGGGGGGGYGRVGASGGCGVVIVRYRSPEDLIRGRVTINSIGAGYAEVSVETLADEGREDLHLFTAVVPSASLGGTIYWKDNGPTRKGEVLHPPLVKLTPETSYRIYAKIAAAEDVVDGDGEDEGTGKGEEAAQFYIDFTSLPVGEMAETSVMEVLSDGTILQTFNADETFALPAKAINTDYRYLVVGGGGAGGGANSYAGGGGGGGAVFEGSVTIAGGRELAVQVGAGGVHATQRDGGASSLQIAADGFLVTALGGGGGGDGTGGGGRAGGCGGGAAGSGGVGAGSQGGAGGKGTYAEGGGGGGGASGMAGDNSNGTGWGGRGGDGVSSDISGLTVWYGGGGGGTGGGGTDYYWDTEKTLRGGGGLGGKGGGGRGSYCYDPRTGAGNFAEVGPGAEGLGGGGGGSLHGTGANGGRGVVILRHLPKGETAQPDYPVGAFMGVEINPDGSLTLTAYTPWAGRNAEATALSLLWGTDRVNRNFELPLDTATQGVRTYRFDEIFKDGCDQSNEEAARLYLQLKWANDQKQSHATGVRDILVPLTVLEPLGLGLDRTRRTVNFQGLVPIIGWGSSTVKVHYGAAADALDHTVELATADYGKAPFQYETGALPLNVDGDEIPTLYYQYETIEVADGREIRHYLSEIESVEVFEEPSADEAYIQDGLIANWDGELNAGAEQPHAAAPEKWVDLVAGRKFALSGVAAQAEAMVFDGTGFGTLASDDTAATFAQISNGTMEVVLDSNVNAAVISQDDGIRFALNHREHKIVLGTIAAEDASTSNLKLVSIVYTNGAPKTVYVNGKRATLEPAGPAPAKPATEIFKKHVSMMASGYAGSTELVRFPVLVRLSEAGVPGFSYADCADGGAGLRFTDAAGDYLPHEIDTWNPSGESCVWVLLPTLSGKTTTFSMHWSPAAGATLPQNEPTDVWVDYVGVWHFSEETGNALDSTANHFDGANTSANTSKVEGKVGYSRQKDTSSFLTEINQLTSKSNPQPLKDQLYFSCSGWMKASSDGEAWRVLFSKGAWDAKKGWYINTQNDTTRMTMVGHNQDTATYKIANIYNAWGYFDCVYNNTTYTVYNNGAPATSDGGGGTKLGAQDSADYKLTFASGLAGQVDEFRIRNGVTTADRAKADYDTQVNADFVAFGAVETTDPAEDVPPECPPGAVMLGAGAGGYMNFVGEIRSIRLYDRPLSTEEIALNQDADRRRFVGNQESESSARAWTAVNNASGANAIEPFPYNILADARQELSAGTAYSTYSSVDMLVDGNIDQGNGYGINTGATLTYTFPSVVETMFDLRLVNAGVWGRRSCNVTKVEAVDSQGRVFTLAGAAELNPTAGPIGYLWLRAADRSPIAYNVKQLIITFGTMEGGSVIFTEIEATGSPYDEVRIKRFAAHRRLFGEETQDFSVMVPTNAVTGVIYDPEDKDAASGDAYMTIYYSTDAEAITNEWTSCPSFAAAYDRSGRAFEEWARPMLSETDYYLRAVYVRESAEGILTARSEVLHYVSVNLENTIFGEGGYIRMTTDNSGDILHVFDTAGDHTFTAPYTEPVKLEYLIVGGGGAGGSGSSTVCGVGGTGGEVVTGSVMVARGVDCPIRVGAGGQRTANYNQKGGNGNQSSLGGIEVNGGVISANGGAGGATASGASRVGGNGAGGLYKATGIAGANGFSSLITGESRAVAGGGGAGGYNGNNAGGNGTDGGGAGATVNSRLAVEGVAGMGGGGGAGYGGNSGQNTYCYGANGGNGVVIIRHRPTTAEMRATVETLEARAHFIGVSVRADVIIVDDPHQFREATAEVYFGFGEEPDAFEYRLVCEALPLDATWTTNVVSLTPEKDYYYGVIVSNAATEVWRKGATYTREATTEPEPYPNLEPMITLVSVTSAVDRISADVLYDTTYAGLNRDYVDVYLLYGDKPDALGSERQIATNVVGYGLYNLDELKLNTNQYVQVFASNDTGKVWSEVKSVFLEAAPKIGDNCRTWWLATGNRSQSGFAFTILDPGPIGCPGVSAAKVTLYWGAEEREDALTTAVELGDFSEAKEYIRTVSGSFPKTFYYRFKIENFITHKTGNYNFFSFTPVFRGGGWTLEFNSGSTTAGVIKDGNWVFNVAIAGNLLTVTSVNTAGTDPEVDFAMPVATEERKYLINAIGNTCFFANTTPNNAGRQVMVRCILPPDLASIGYQAFQNLPKLEYLSPIPPRVKTLSYGVIYNCPLLKELDLGNVESAGTDCCGNNKALTNVVARALTNVDARAFIDLPALKSIAFGDGEVRLGNVNDDKGVIATGATGNGFELHFGRGIFVRQNGDMYKCLITGKADDPCRIFIDSPREIERWKREVANQPVTEEDLKRADKYGIRREWVFGVYRDKDSTTRHLLINGTRIPLVIKLK